MSFHDHSNELQQIIEKLKLVPHPEGGYYSRTFESHATLKETNNDERPLSSAIYFLLTNEKSISRLHKLKKSDEVWHFYHGNPISVVTLDPKTGEAHKTILGSDLLKGHLLQYNVPPGCKSLF
jgi:predicted cupin superfamily sugar epimerase